MGEHGPSDSISDGNYEQYSTSEYSMDDGRISPPRNSSLSSLLLDVFNFPSYHQSSNKQQHSQTSQTLQEVVMEQETDDNIGLDISDESDKPITTGTSNTHATTELQRSCPEAEDWRDVLAFFCDGHESGPYGTDPLAISKSVSYSSLLF